MKLTEQQVNNLRFFVGMIAGRHETALAFAKYRKVSKKNINWEKYVKKLSDKAMELMCNPDTSPCLEP